MKWIADLQCSNLHISYGFDLRTHLRRNLRQEGPPLMSLLLSPTAPAPAPTGSPIHIAGLSRSFGVGGDTVTAISEMSIDVRPGEFVRLVGASGCGKTTLLNIVAGLDHPSSGAVDTGGGTVSLMFQEGALFPWLSARRNIELGLRLAGVRGRQAAGTGPWNCSHSFV